MESVPPTVLKPRDIEFAAHLALGIDASEAYRKAFKAKRLPADVVAKRAHRLANQEVIRDRVALCVSELKLEQLDSLGRCYRDLLESLAECRAAKNFNAYFSGMRLRLQCQGMLKENLNISSEAKMTDDQIVERIAAKDPHTAAMLRAVLGSSDAFKA